MKDLIKILSDPLSNRVLQMIRTAGNMTVTDILTAAPDIPRATLYRRMEKMLKAGAVEITGTNKVRGQTENVYSIKNIFISKPENNEDSMKMMTAVLMQIYELNRNYFQRSDADADRDKLFVFNYALSLSDSDFAGMMSEIMAVAEKYQKKPYSDDSKTRNLYFMSMPGGNNDEKKK